MNILLINTRTRHVKHLPALPLGLLSIATRLAEKGHTVQLYDREVQGGSCAKNETFVPDVVAISGHSYANYPDAFRISKYYRGKNIPVVWGGQMASLIPAAVLNNGAVDYVVVGEGEITLCELLDAMANKTPLRDIDGLAYLDNGKPVVNKNRQPAPLSELPVIDFSCIDPELYCGPYIGCEKMLTIYASKGCLFQCTYCYNSCHTEGAWRGRPAEYFISEIKYLVDRCGIDGVFFIDDLFGPSPAYLSRVCSEIIAANLGVIWGCYTRADLCSKEVLQTMHDAGCRWIMFGVETGSEARQVSTKKHLNLAKTKEIVAACREIGIFTNTTFMLGFPDETTQELRQTIDYMQNLGADVVVPNYCGILPQSAMFRELSVEMKRQAVRSYGEAEDFKMMDQLGGNYSKIPTRELKVVSACFYWAGMFPKDSGRRKTSDVFLKRAMMQIDKSLRLHSFHSFLLIIPAAKEFAHILFYAKLFPGIRKKYGIR